MKANGVSAGNGRAPAQVPRGRGPLVKQLWFWVILAICLGVVFGLVAPEQAKGAKWLADGFLQLVKTIAAPVIFVTVVIGIASLGDMARAGGLAVRALGYFFIATVIALALGLIVGNIVAPGDGLHIVPSAAQRAAAAQSIAEAHSDHGFTAFVLDDLLPTSFIAPFVGNEILRVLVLAILTAFGVSALPDDQRIATVRVFETVSKIVFALIKVIMWAAPLGAFGGMAFTVAEFGGGTLANMAKLAVTFWLTCAFFVFVVLNIVARASGFSLVKFIRLIKDELLIIVGTSSSETVLPRLLAKLESAGASPQVTGVVLPAGYSFNLDGTAIYLTLGALFIVQATGQDMSVGAQIGLAALMILTSKGAAGVTGAGLVTLTASMQTFGGEFFSAQTIAVGIALVVGIDRLMSEGRALTNAIGNCVATVVIAKSMGELHVERFQACLDNPDLADPDHPDLEWQEELHQPLRKPAPKAPRVSLHPYELDVGLPGKPVPDVQ